MVDVECWNLNDRGENEVNHVIISLMKRGCEIYHNTCLKKYY